MTLAWVVGAGIVWCVVMELRGALKSVAGDRKSWCHRCQETVDTNPVPHCARCMSPISGRAHS